MFSVHLPVSRKPHVTASLPMQAELLGPQPPKLVTIVNPCNPTG